MDTNIIRAIFLTLGAIFALLLLIAGIGGWLITGPAPAYPGTPVEPSDEAALSLDDKIAEFEQDIAQASVGEEVTLEITEEEATSKLDQMAKEGELSVEMNHIQIHFTDSTVYASALFRPVIYVQVAIQAKIEAKDGKPDITIESLHIGRLPIPKTLINNVMTALEREIEDRWEALPIEIEQIIIQNGEIIIVGRVKQSS